MKTSTYYQINDEDLQGVIHIRAPDLEYSFRKSEQIVVHKNLKYTRDIITDELIGPIEAPAWTEIWERTKWILFVILIIIPFLVFPIDVISKCGITSILGLIACCFPSGGAPVAGGIIFIPSLSYLGLSAKQCVAFCAATQALGCGVFTPLNWYSKDPGILIKSTFAIVVPSSILGLYCAIFVFPLNDNEVKMFFTGFCFFLALTVIYGLYKDTLTHQDEPLAIFEKSEYSLSDSNISTVRFNSYTRRTWLSIFMYALVGFIGGILVGEIGIGIEKVFFLVATNYHRAEIKRATVTAIAIVGWLSCMSACIHLFVLKDVPLAYWVCALPGVLLGSIVGPKVNAYLGSKNVMIVFCMFLFLNVAYDLLK